MLLDPLKSELNWPTGQKQALDLEEGGIGPTAKERMGLRHRLPFHILDLVFAASQDTSLTVNFEDRREAQDALTSLKAKIRAGCEQKALQTTPHLVILSREYYSKEMLPHLADWTALFLDKVVRGQVSSAELRGLLQKPWQLEDSVKEKLRVAEDWVLKPINLAISWLHQLLPHILSKVHRVSFGLLTGDDLASALRNRGTAKSRLRLAVPFVGKDTPSEQSEFSHPDVTIGFTILAYRHSGLRGPPESGDVRELLKILLDDMKLENTVRYHRRTACLAYVAMIRKAGGVVRGFTEEGKWKEDLSEADRKRQLTRPLDALALDAAPRPSMWPLEMIDLADPEQLTVVHDMLWNCPMAMQYLLDHSVFLPNAGIIDCNPSQFTASGQELAGPQLFGFCLGFSGTPNDLLPKAMGKCAFAEA
ncbi:unnamed protein product [Polarella glacialis]|uniref:ubiquitinyl hydrolase 1 n=1 Tax=Polarella glacialis TaxID=89957 RepID=A0A813JQI2_POLGL|nr:unnamed protein product [Polarella glacialis]CAE8648135.1 unnamed protein product [Polarella glacialis]CAE8684465.1 unnamed protein product [Polarella glacialis]